MEHMELGGEVGKNPLEGLRASGSAGARGTSPGADEQERLVKTDRRKETTPPGPVKADRLGVEYDVMAYPVFTKMNIGGNEGESMYTTYSGQYSTAEESCYRGYEGRPGRGTQDMESLLRTLVEERTLALSRGPPRLQRRTTDGVDRPDGVVLRKKPST